MLESEFLIGLITLFSENVSAVPRTKFPRDIPE